MTKEQTPYLIQRCKRKSLTPVQKAHVTGIDSILSFEYMGSSEFEWGALPKALRSLCRQADTLKVEKAPFGQGRALWLVCPAATRVVCLNMLAMAAKETHHTKEYVGIEAYLNGDEARHGYKDYAAWWDIDHDWIACVDKELAQLVVYGIKKVRDRWKKEGKL